MAGQARFRYQLEPVRLTRQWELDGLLAELADANLALASVEAEMRQVLAQVEAAQQEWRRLGQGTGVHPARFLLLTNYIGDCRTRLRAVEEDVKQAEEARAALIERVTAVRKALDAVEEHRGKMRAQYLRQRQCGDFKEADDHWRVSRAGTDYDQD